MKVSSAVPEGKGVSSSASVEVASMAAIAAARGNFIYLIFQTLRTVFSGLNLLTSFYLLIKKKNSIYLVYGTSLHMPQIIRMGLVVVE